MKIPAFDSTAFRRKFHYTGHDLGAVYTKDATTFRIWAPLADAVAVVFYRAGLGGNRAGYYPMKPAGNLGPQCSPAATATIGIQQPNTWNATRTYGRGRSCPRPAEQRR